MPLRIFRSRPIVAANVIQMLSVAGMFGMFFLGALYLRRVLGYDALHIGLAFLPATISMGTLSIGYSDRIFMALGARLTLLARADAGPRRARPVRGRTGARDLPDPGGAVAAAARAGRRNRVPGADERRDDGSHPRDAGLASGLVNTTAQVGGALGLAVLATLSTSHSNALKAGGESTASALTSGYHLAFWVASALVGCALVVVLTAIDGGRRGARGRRRDRGRGRRRASRCAPRAGRGGAELVRAVSAAGERCCRRSAALFVAALLPSRGPVLADAAGAEEVGGGGSRPR